MYNMLHIVLLVTLYIILNRIHMNIDIFSFVTKQYPHIVIKTPMI